MVTPMMQTGVGMKAKATPSQGQVKKLTIGDQVLKEIQKIIENW